jgi:hypothetical protein
MLCSLPTVWCVMGNYASGECYAVLQICGVDCVILCRVNVMQSANCVVCNG